MRNLINLVESWVKDSGDIQSELIEITKVVKEKTGAILDLDMLDPDEIFLSYVQRGSEAGSGGRAVAMLLDFADERNMKVTLTVLHNAPRLIQYYLRMGFLPNDFDNREEFDQWFAEHEANWTFADSEDDEGISMTRSPE